MCAAAVCSVTLVAVALALVLWDGLSTVGQSLAAMPRWGGLYCAVLCCAVLCCAVLCCAVLCCAVLCAVLCCAVLRGAVLRYLGFDQWSGNPRRVRPHASVPRCVRSFLYLAIQPLSLLILRFWCDTHCP